MPKNGPRIDYVNGYAIIEIADGEFVVSDDDGPRGDKFTSFDDAADFADTLPSREPPRR